ncbi:MAG TPA: MBL fold metallo-hydrolase [Gemmatimonadaceae bacterium]|nr:MBL fold metallo-hydrolase [Gemmatimonadaceae bacterium]
MHRLLALATIALVLAAPNAYAQTALPRALLDRAARAMGGAQALDSLRNKTIDFNTVGFAIGQEETPDGPPRATLSFGRTVTDYAGTRRLTTQDVRAVNGMNSRQRRVSLATMSMIETNGALAMDPASVPAGLERALSLQLERVLLAASHHESATSPLRSKVIRGEMADGIRVILGPDTASLWFDRASGLPIALETLTDDGVLGDRRTVTLFGRWQDAGGLALPRQIDVEVNGRLQSHTVITAATVNDQLADSLFIIPDSMKAKAPTLPNTANSSTPAPVEVPLVSIAPGVWRAEGANHFSLVVEQGPGLLVIEAPLSSARSNAVLDTLRKRFPGRPVTAVVMTHHHHDHSGGIRGYMARGIRVIAHQRNREFVREVASARKTVAPDRLSRGAPAPVSIAVRDSLVLGSGQGRVVVYPVPSAHAKGILAAWVPSAGIVFTSDVLSPQANQPISPTGSREMVAFAKSVGIAPTRFVGGHGVPVEWSAVEGAGKGEHRD